MLETWIEGHTLAAIAYVIELILIGIVVALLILLLAKEPKQEVCYECGKKFTASVQTPLRTRGWDKPFCSDGCKVDYRMSRI